MSIDTNQKRNLSILYKISGIAFIFYVIFSVILIFVNTELFLAWINLIISFLIFIIFAIVLYQTGKSFEPLRSQFNIAVGWIIGFVIVDLITFLLNYFDIGLGFGILLVIIFGYGLLRGLAFTYVNRTLGHQDLKMSNPVFLVYGWADIVSTVIFFFIPEYWDDLYFDIIYYLDLLLILIIGIIIFMYSRRIMNIEISPSLITSPQVLYQPIISQTYGETKTSKQGMKGIKQICENCGVSISPEDIFCENCGSKL